MPFRWQSPPPDAVFAAGLKRYQSALAEALYQLALSFAPKIETWMKQNAPWTDRTGNLRSSLYAEVERLVGEAVTIQLDYGLDYGKYLEFAHAGKFAIIGPALDHWSPLVWAAVKELIS